MYNNLMERKPPGDDVPNKSLGVPPRGLRPPLRCFGIIFLATLIFTLLGSLEWVFGQSTVNDYNPSLPPDRYAERTEPYFWQPSDFDSNNAAVNRYIDNPFRSTPVPDPPYPEALAAEGNMSLTAPEEVLPPAAEWLRSPDGLVSTLQIMVLLTVITLSPSIMIMTTSYIRVMTVLAILRQAIGTNQLPPSQVITALSLFVTFLIMMPVWSEVYIEAVLPFQERRIGLEVAWKKAELPIRSFMSAQIMRCGNEDTVIALLGYIHEYKPPPGGPTWKTIPWAALLPGFMLSELKTAFAIGFQIYLPFLVLDMIISSVMVSMGMMMLPPVIISLPFKLMLFVLMDGWELVILMLLDSFQHYKPGELDQIAMLSVQCVLGFG